MMNTYDIEKDKAALAELTGQDSRADEKKAASKKKAAQKKARAVLNSLGVTIKCTNGKTHLDAKHALTDEQKAAAIAAYRELNA